MREHRALQVPDKLLALANATGVRFAHLPFTPDRIFDKLGVAT
jgi:hypothetical protein